MKESPLVTIGLTCFNCEKTIERALKSAINQDWKNKDKDFVLDLLHSKYVLTVHGSGFSEKYGKNHFRIVFLPSEEILVDAFDRIDNLLKERR